MADIMVWCHHLFDWLYTPHVSVTK